MKIETIYSGCLAQGAYYIESASEAAIIDPLREIKPYIRKAQKRQVRVKYIFETHFQADFFAGHQDLSKETGAPIIFGPNAMKLGKHCIVAKDGELFKIGKAKIKLIHTPGHTLESSCYLLINEAGKEEAIFTGKTLFIGEVGCPDLAQKALGELDIEKLGAYLYDSLREKILPLPNDLMVYPAHGAASACGKNRSKKNLDSLGNQKITNYGLQEMSKSQFIEMVTKGSPPPPPSYTQKVSNDVPANHKQDKVFDRAIGFTPQEFETLAKGSGALILDTRDAQVYSSGFIPYSINIGIDGNFSVWVDNLISDFKQKILLVADPGREKEAVTRLVRLGFDHTIGFLRGGFEAWKKEGREVEVIHRITPEDLASLRESGKKTWLLDVRKKSEYNSEHILSSQNLPLDVINKKLSLISRKKIYYVFCEGGYLSMAFNSILKARGFENLVDVKGGLKAMKNTGRFQMSNYSCPTTLL